MFRLDTYQRTCRHGETGEPALAPGARWRMLRGLVLHGLGKTIAERRANAAAHIKAPRRGCLIGGGVPYIKKGTCSWCYRQAPSKRHNWHRLCNIAYYLAIGNQSFMTGWLCDIQKGKCQSCSNKFDFSDDWRHYRKPETDHRLAVSVAAATSLRARAKAHDISNLQALCHKCHAGKTADDRRKLNIIARLGYLPKMEKLA